MESLNFEQTMMMLNLAKDEDLDDFEERMLESKENQEEMVEELLINLMATNLVLARIKEIRKERGI